MEHIRCQINEELTKPRLDKGRLFEILKNLTIQLERGVDGTVTGELGPMGPPGEQGSEGPEGPRGLRGPEGVCRCNITNEAVPKVDEAVTVVPVKKVVATAIQVKKTVIKKKVVS